MRQALALASAAAALLCSGAAAAKTYTVVVDKLKFGQLPAGLRVGDILVWDNRDLFLHSVTARDKSFDVSLPAGKSSKMVLKRAGQTPFFCKYHPGMTGMLKVAK